ncbi:HD family phosphohydrolase [Clostridium novyi A str. 4552]|uniref:HD family phosphohydrolase n=2 Tax=Clostridium novyi TaxID=1542 RepID=A0A0A0I6F8_CLONO|nr:HD family phosphohydrolase [Clostridium novyi A str. 4552]
MMMQRVKQFYMNVTSKVTHDDRIFIENYLNKNEMKLFYNLSISEQCHSVRVAKDIKKYLDNKNEYLKYKFHKKELIRVALLHDIGKIKCHLNVFEKSILVLLDKFTKGRLKNFKSIKKVNVYYNHGIMGEDILNKMRYSERFLYLVKNHHNNDIIGDMELDILKKCDDRN